MNLKRFVKPIILAACGLVLTVGASLAAQATNSLNVRSGPNTSYRVVDVLYPGEHVNVRDCRRNGWCFITHRGADGWVSSRYLTNSGYVQPRYKKRYVVPSQPHRRSYRNKGNSITLNFGTGGFGFSINPTYPSYRDCIYRRGKRYCR